MKRIIPTILAVLAVINLVWLFVFDYRIPSLPGGFSFGQAKPVISEETLPAAEGEEEGAEQAEDKNVEEPVQAVLETAAENQEEGGQTEEAEMTCRPLEGNTPNIRSGPGSEYDVVGLVGSESVMTVRGEAEGGWLPIRTQDGLEGYVFEELVVIDEAEE